MINPNFQDVGKAFGIKSLRASTFEETTTALEKMKNWDLERGPILCEFVVEKEENVFPMVPPGKSLGDTIFGKC